MRGIIRDIASKEQGSSTSKIVVRENEVVSRQQDPQSPPMIRLGIDSGWQGQRAVCAKF
jgi:hypothetical protein